MSSIFGQLNFDKKPIKEEELMAVQRVLDHGQADRKGIWISNNIGFGHLMMFNTPESLTEKQPSYKDGSGLSITADARIDNRDELFSKLDIKAEKQFVSDSDLILLTYEKYGQDCVQHLIGDFAFAIWSESEKRLFCARDHLGVKPFFYYHNVRFFAFATEKKGILILPGIDKTVDKQFFFNALIKPGEQAADTTLYQYIKRLPPAHTLTINVAGGDFKLHRYWTLDPYTEIRFAKRDDYYEGLLSHFDEAVKCRTRSHFGVGSQLSGGIDSSAITGVASRVMRANGKELFTLSNTLADDVTDVEIIKTDERRYIDEVNKFNNIKTPIYVTKHAFENMLEELDFSLSVNDGFERWDPVWLISLKQSAMQHGIRALLSGFPGDELVTYRGKFHFMDYLDQRRYLTYIRTKRKFSGLSKIEPLMPFWLRYGIRNIKTSLNLNNQDIASAQKMFDIPKSYIQHRTDCIWDDHHFREQLKSYRHLQRYRLLKPQVTQRMESETRYGLYFKNEPRFPMADIRLAQYYLSIPNDLKYEGQLARTAFRKAMKNDLPALILERDSKEGSVAPFLSLLKADYNAIRDIIEHVGHEKLVDKQEILRRAEISQQLGKGIKEKHRDVRIKSKMPSIKILRWLEKNPGAI
jgi:asparagine synthase (glutamine-hydrolysing)